MYIKIYLDCESLSPWIVYLKDTFPEMELPGSVGRCTFSFESWSKLHPIPPKSCASLPATENIWEPSSRMLLLFLIAFLLTFCLCFSSYVTHRCRQRYYYLLVSNFNTSVSFFALASNSRAMINNSGENGHLCLFSDSDGKVSYFFIKYEIKKSFLYWEF